jgi:hypothetical protein
MDELSKTPEDRSDLKLRKFRNHDQIVYKLRQLRLQKDQQNLLKRQQEERDQKTNIFAALADFNNIEEYFESRRASENYHRKAATSDPRFRQSILDLANDCDRCANEIFDNMTAEEQASVRNQEKALGNDTSALAIQADFRKQGINMFPTLLKLSNKLDMAGLTREADLLDLIVEAGVKEDLDEGFFGKVEEDVVKPSGTAEVIPFKAFDTAFDRLEQPQYYWRVAFAPDKVKLTQEQLAMEGKRVSKDFLDEIEAKGVSVTSIPVEKQRA